MISEKYTKLYRENPTGATWASLEIQFKAELEQNYGVTNNPKASLLYAKAYELGHSNGFHDIESYYSDLVDLIL